MDRHSEEKEMTAQERIADRRRALNARIAARKAAGQEVTAKDDDGDAMAAGHKGEETVRQQRKRLAMLKSKAEDAITRFRVMTDLHEGERRVREEALAATRQDKIDDDAGMTRRSQAHITNAFQDLATGVGTGIAIPSAGNNWHEKREYKASRPQELYKALLQQKQECAAAIDVKDRLIAELRSQMRDKEEEYVLSLKHQADDIDRLIATMHSETDSLVAAYGVALEEVERAHIDERRVLIDNNESEIDKMVALRGTRQLEISAKREQIVAKDQDQLTLEFEENAEKYNQLKMATMRDIHELEQKYETIQAQFYLNSEKLTYNLQVLRERKAENEKQSNIHRKKQGRLQDILSTLIAKYNESDKKFRTSNKDLTEGYRRITSQYKDLQKKFQHFEKADAEKFRQVWAMHERECMGLVEECLRGDRVVFEEILGLRWQPQSLDFWLQASSKSGLDGLSGGGGTAGSSAAGGGGDTMGASSSHNGEDIDETEVVDKGLDVSQLSEHICEMIYTQMPFLVDEQEQQHINELTDEEGEEAAVSVKVKAILGCLGVKNNADLRQLVDYFVTVLDDEQEALINPQEAAGKLINFLQEQARMQSKRRQQHSADGAEETTTGGGAAGTTTTTSSGTGNTTTLAKGVTIPPLGSSQSTVAASLITTAKQRQEAEKRQQESDFWVRMSNVIPPAHLRTWQSVEKAMEKYVKQLQKRHKLIDETDGIRKQNDELRGLLKQYLGSSLNDELFSPPQLQVVVNPSSTNRFM